MIYNPKQSNATQHTTPKPMVSKSGEQRRENQIPKKKKSSFFFVGHRDYRLWPSHDRRRHLHRLLQGASILAGPRRKWILCLRVE